MTIYDIAKMAGVNASTVSRVINGKPGCGKEKREMILALLKEYNFIPDETARNLVNQHNNTIGILTDDLQSAHMNEAIAILQKELLNNGYHCYIGYVKRGAESVENGIRDLVSHKVEGALLLGMSFHDSKSVEPEIEKYMPEKPVVMVHQLGKFTRENIYVIGADETNGVRRCVELLLGRGRKNLMMIIDRGRTSAGKLKKTFEQTVAELGEGVTATVYADVPYRGPDAESTVSSILAANPGVDGLFCTHDRIAINAIYALQDLGRNVPGDVSVIGEDNSDLCKVCRPKLTSMDTMLQETTLLSAKTLIDVLDGKRRAHRVTLEMDVKFRDSL